MQHLGEKQSESWRIGKMRIPLASTEHSRYRQVRCQNQKEWELISTTKMINLLQIILKKSLVTIIVSSFLCAQ